MKRVIVLCMLCLGLVGACGGDEPVDEGIDSSQQSMTDHCRLICPKCPPKEVCLLGCYLECKEVCGPTLCKYGEVCCNESCGICTPPGGYCTEQFCLSE